MAKGKLFSGAHYMCSMAAGCSVRKQIQRCADDRTILVTTYEGKHNHPLPPAAMAMASTTYVAASMLLFGSTSSTNAASINLNLLDPSNLTSSSTLANISASAAFNTITLDLTHSPIDPIDSQKQQSLQQPLLADPKFLAAITTAIRSIVGGGADVVAPQAENCVTVSSAAEFGSDS